MHSPQHANIKAFLSFFDTILAVGPLMAMSMLPTHPFRWKKHAPLANGLPSWKKRTMAQAIGGMGCKCPNKFDHTQPQTKCLSYCLASHPTPGTATAIHQAHGRCYAPMKHATIHIYRHIYFLCFLPLIGSGGAGHVKARVILFPTWMSQVPIHTFWAFGRWGLDKRLFARQAVCT